MAHNIAQQISSLQLTVADVSSVVISEAMVFEPKGDNYEWETKQFGSSNRKQNQNKLCYSPLLRFNNLNFSVNHYL